MKIRNKSLTDMAYVYKLGNLKIDKDSIVEVPLGFTEAQVRDAILFYPELVLIEGSIVTREDLDYGDEVGNPGVMIKDVYDTNYNNIVDTSETSEAGGITSIDMDFDFNDFGSVNKDIDTIKAGFNVEQVKLIVDIPFDGGALVTVGDDTDNERFMDNNDNALGYAGTYIDEKTYIYSIDTTAKLYFSGNPTTGSGKVIIFVS